MFYLLPVLVSFLFVLILVPGLRAIAFRIGFVLGGIALYIASLTAMILFTRGSALVLTVGTGGTVLMLMGLFDDWFKTKGKDFPVWPRLIIYLIVSAIPVFFGIEIIGVSKLEMGTGMVLFPAWISWLSTMAWVFGITNMVNFIDGLDGLASGIVTISSLTLLITALLMQQTEPAVLSGSLAGACLAFLFFNFHPARIFMGDAGAIYLGYTLAVISIDGAFKSATVISIFVPVLALGVPILDTVIVFARRFIQKKGLHKADKLHTHHCLMAWGLTQTQSVSFLYLVSAVFSLVSIVLLLAFQ
ncbi:MraY family glycosyltransferase [Paenibacillus larvae]|uniref:Putative undecaprenyl-phosphate N-acetylglucosaminyl 1-phosphate transferase TagO n=1 Tax=Paenibacillus larvae subsp. larvae DSM 25430 TaxID=697284 RepID=V9W4M8_9BACL|nr:MraY family glycosyltransferase [Paenibacillus larvae]AHD04092.1 putative undecaprenyl-phosphate N-acetylglucosaminyl 1-phosphate transferase TagO [Paenibacillus larvae subsp. larvae DSM 25430]AVG10701.1 putative undecaprenyl-phosphate N-acetylglucosaminyl 1-phosphate transferase TagO [Paenibacillus larvae subsp. larvae DSM 25430]MDR5567503.1 MraY family glycosyltransferase [Paenibacillus larvae]MDR5594491.1 MraY family glycosyltransferase [Paenibacillus larvae]